jgi:hypothetical protein
VISRLISADDLQFAFFVSRSPLWPRFFLLPFAFFPLAAKSFLNGSPRAFSTGSF